jgi:hypothetical protein
MDVSKGAAVLIVFFFLFLVCLSFAIMVFIVGFSFAESVLAL